MRRPGGGGGDDTTMQDDDDKDAWKLRFALSSKECHDRGWITTTSSFDEREARALKAYIQEKLAEHIAMK